MRKRILFCALAVLLVLTAASCGTPQTSGGTQSVPLTDTAGQEATQTPQYDPALPQDREDAPGMPGDAPTNAEESEAANPAQTASQPEGKFGPLFEQYVHGPVSDGAYTISMQQSGISMVTTVTGGDSALDSNMANVLHITLINQGGKYYMLMHGTKKYAEMTAEDYAKQVASLQTASLDLENVRFLESGTQTVGGKQYSTETYDEGARGKVTYFFNDAGLARMRTKKDGKTNDVESVAIRDEADMDLFTVPSGFQLVSDPSLLLAS